MDKPKTPVRLRRRALKNGNESLYLDIYRNGQRRREYLKLYLVPGQGAKAKAQNRETLALAEAVQAERIVQIQREGFGFPQRDLGKLGFIDTLERYLISRMGTVSLGAQKRWENAAMHMRACFGDQTKFREVNRDWGDRFARYLAQTPSQHKGRPLKANTQVVLYNYFRAFMGFALEEGYIQREQMPRRVAIRREATARAYLSLEEIRQLARTPYPRETLRRAFLFSCLTGLRYSDILALEWGGIREENGYTRITFRQQKTGGLEYLDISPEAAQYLGPRAPATAHPFEGVNSPSTLSVNLRKWCQLAGIDKPITFHSGRHTFATLMLSLNTDLHTVQKLLGHQSIETTQIYAKMLDAQKREAVARIPRIGGLGE